ncbi:prolyl oligopeptidase family serine peptidase [Sphingobacterium bovistauri]|uniref:Prolyl oligopeptidase family serine peptidase n=1 Tax=Sphingobacterium bovistauri TaxID=2781959 RepID=A0ABS7Z829_9SPHI|nr:prolyl oligopeptidase family serine peptidase [Sphingobacterium bovistauri]MCA5004844.1 prolyl oligopeptidase family serine peptidase [Sphingobacterium bovistauri]
MKKLKLILLYPIFALLFTNCSKEDKDTILPVTEDVIMKDVTYGPHERNKMDVLLPSGRNTTQTKILVLIHGGGWIGGDKSDFDILLNTDNLENLKKEFPNIAIFTLNYRLTTSNANQFPAAEQDIKEAMDFIFRNSNSYQVNSNTTYILGASAGAHLAALYTVKNPSSRIKGTIGISGAYELKSLYTDGNKEAKDVLEAFLGGTPQSKEKNYFDASPINFIQPGQTKYLLLHGKEDQLTPISQAEKFETALKVKNVNVQKFYYSGGHGIPPEHITQGLQTIGDFLK